MKIKAGIVTILANADIGDFDNWVWEKIANEILSFLHSKGVVIKVDKELGDIVGEGEYHEGEQAERTWMLKAGYVVTKPLIKDN